MSEIAKKINYAQVFDNGDWVRRNVLTTLVEEGGIWTVELDCPVSTKHIVLDPEDLLSLMKKYEDYEDEE